MEKCGCGHMHCCHKKTKITRLYDSNEGGNGFFFDRKECADPNCGKWLGDTIVKNA